MTSLVRTPVRQKAKELAKSLKKERPDYNYMRELFRHLRRELSIEITQTEKKLPYVPTEEEIRKYYDIVLKSRNMGHVIIIKTLLYTGVRVSELVKIKLSEVDSDRCQIKITQGKGKKDRIVPFPNSFKETLMLHVENTRKKGGEYLFESSWKKSYTDRGIRRILAEYTKAAGIGQSISPHTLRHFLFTWLKKQGIEDALIQPYSGHESRQSLEIYSKLSIGDAQKEYENIIGKFPI
jgi:integrase/recombinase XerD